MRVYLNLCLNFHSLIISSLCVCVRVCVSVSGAQLQDPALPRATFQRDLGGRSRRRLPGPPLAADQPQQPQEKGLPRQVPRPGNGLNISSHFPLVALDTHTLTHAHTHT